MEGIVYEEDDFHVFNDNCTSIGIQFRLSTNSCCLNVHDGSIIQEFYCEDWKHDTRICFKFTNEESLIGKGTVLFGLYQGDGEQNEHFAELEEVFDECFPGYDGTWNYSKQWAMLLNIGFPNYFVTDKNLFEELKESPEEMVELMETKIKDLLDFITKHNLKRWL